MEIIIKRGRLTILEAKNAGNDKMGWGRETKGEKLGLEVMPDRKTVPLNQKSKITSYLQGSCGFTSTIMQYL